MTDAQSPDGKDRFEDNEISDRTPLDRIVDLRLLAIWPGAALVIVIGNVTGHYQGVYAQTRLATYVNVVLLVLMMAAMLVVVPAVQKEYDNAE